MSQEEFKNYSYDYLKTLCGNVETVDCTNKDLRVFGCISKTLYCAMRYTHKLITDEWNKLSIKPSKIMFRNTDIDFDNTLSSDWHLLVDFRTRDILDIDLSLEDKFYKYLKEGRYLYKVRCGWEGISPTAGKGEGQEFKQYD